MKTLAIILAVFLAPAVHAQACAAGTVTNNPQNTPNSCVQVSMPAGIYVQQLGLPGAMSAQTICSASIDPADPQFCAAGFYRLDIQIVPGTLGTLVSAVSSTMSWTDDVRTYSNVPLLSNLSLVTTTPGQVSYSFYKSAGTIVTVNTTVGTLTGTPTYNFRARLFRAPGS